MHGHVPRPLETMARTKFITWITDFITSSERSKVILSTIISVIKMETKFLDLFKDLGLSIYLLGRGEYSLEEWNDFESKTRHFGQKKLCSKLPKYMGRYTLRGILVNNKPLHEQYIISHITQKMDQTDSHVQIGNV